MKRRALALASFLIFAGCRKGPAPARPAPPAPERADVQYLDPVQHLIRISLDLRGVRPTIGELNDIEQHPDRMRGKIRDYLEDPRFAERVKEIWNEGFLTRQDRTYFPGPPELTDATLDDFARAATQEPLELIAHVVMNDRPFTEIVTADYTVANEVLAHFYDIDRPVAAPPADWVEAPYTDGRPNAGVLSTTAFHTRWTTTDSNRNRGRANAWSRALLCFDFFTRDIVIDTALDLSDPNVVNNAVRTNVGSSRVDLQACKLEYSIVSPK